MSCPERKSRLGRGLFSTGWAAGAAAAAMALACASPSPRPAEPAAGHKAPPAAPAPTEKPRALAPLTARESALAEELARYVRHLAEKIGERSSEQGWNVAGAADYLVGRLEAAGYSVTRQGFEVGEGDVAQNLEVQVSGAEHGDELIVVGAHYGSAIGSPGANDNGSGVAALLAMARAARSLRPARAMRFVAFANQNKPLLKTPQMGSTVYAKRAAARGDNIICMINVEAIGYFSVVPGSQRRPGVYAEHFGDTADFVALVGNERSREVTEVLLRMLERGTSLPVAGGVLPDEAAELGGADHWAFWQLGFPAVIVTDTGSLRYPHHHQTTDTPEKLDFERMARVVAGLEKAVFELAGVDGNER